MEYYLQETSIDAVKIIYPMLANEFPAEELKSEEQLTHLCKSGYYKILFLMSEEALIGFVCLCEIKITKIMWMDYIVICEGFRNKGIGTKFMQLIIDYVSGMNALLFEVEIPNSDNKKMNSEQLNRIQFYEKFCATLVLSCYFLPYKEGTFPMWLYSIPCNDSCEIDRELIFQSIEFIFDTVHSDISERYEILNKIIRLNTTSSS